jgi:hypothetical protein
VGRHGGYEGAAKRSEPHLAALACCGAAGCDPDAFLCVLEALVAEYGVDAAVQALDNQGFKGSAYTYLLKPLHAEACRRRLRAKGDREA